MDPPPLSVVPVWREKERATKCQRRSNEPDTRSNNATQSKTSSSVGTTSAAIPRSRTNLGQFRGDMLLRSVSRSGFAYAEKPFAIRRTYRGLADIGRR